MLLIFCLRPSSSGLAKVLLGQHIIELYYKNLFKSCNIFCCALSDRSPNQIAQIKDAKGGDPNSEVNMSVSMLAVRYFLTMAL